MHVLVSKDKLSYSLSKQVEVKESDKIYITYMEMLSKGSRALLWKNLRSSHRSMHHLQVLSRQGILELILKNCKVLICPFCQFWEVHKRISHKRVIVNKTIKILVDLIIMDQAVSIIPIIMATSSDKQSNK